MFSKAVKTTVKAAVALSIILCAQTHAANAASDDDLDIRVCAAVYPCDNNGNVLPEFLNENDPCSEVYIQQCAIQEAKRNKASEVSCNSKNVKLERKISWLRGELRKMKSRNDRLLRSQRSR